MPATPAPTSFPWRKAFPLFARTRRLAEGELNPIFVKEMRQAVRGRAVVSYFLLALLTMFGVSAFMLLAREVTEPDFGSQLFATLLSALTLLTTLCVAGWSGGRMIAERSGADGVDMLYYTPLSAEEIVQGKCLSNVTLAAVFFSAGAPFLAITPLLRGVDVPTVILITSLNFLTVVLLCQAGLVVASLPVGRVFKTIIGLMVGLSGAPFLLGWLAFCLSYAFSADSARLPLIYLFSLAMVLGLLALNVLIVMAASYLAPRNGIYFRRGPLESCRPRSPLPPPLP